MSDFYWDEIVSIEEVGEGECYDISILEEDVYDDEPNFVVENIVVHNCQMHTRFVERKKGREKYDLHPLLRPILEKTYGVLCFQEQIMKILNVVGNIPLKDCELVRKAISAKQISGFFKYKEMFIENGIANLSCTKEYIENFWDQIESFAEYGFNASHAVAYSYLAAQLLYLKAHYPHEFYTSVLSCETDSSKIKEYKTEARIHKVELMRVDINKSGVNFELIDDKIYFGISNIKGIGVEVAKKIVELQPFKSFEDFLLRFGTNATAIKPILGLRCFKDRDPITLWKFTEHVKDFYKKIDDKRKRLSKSLEKYEVDFKILMPEETRNLTDLEGDEPFLADEWKKYDKNEFIIAEREVKAKESDPEAYSRVVVLEQEFDESISVEQEVIRFFRKKKIKKSFNLYQKLKDLWRRRKMTISKIENRIAASQPKLADFDPNIWEMSEELAKDLCDPIKCEELYYGFAWVHDLEESPDYIGNLTFDILKDAIDVSSGPVEIKINKVTQIESKKGTIYYQVLAEDVNGQQNRINLWQDDWDWWHDVFKPGNLVRVKLQPPSGGFNTFTLESNRVGYRGKRYKEKEDDIRVIPYRKGEKKLEKYLTDEEALAQFENCIME